METTARSSPTIAPYRGGEGGVGIAKQSVLALPEAERMLKVISLMVKEPANWLPAWKTALRGLRRCLVFLGDTGILHSHHGY